jgi:hypothetical protein
VVDAVVNGPAFGLRSGWVRASAKLENDEIEAFGRGGDVLRKGSIERKREE